MSRYCDKPQSLIERKKQQWAIEREELAGLSAPWGERNSSSYYSRTRKFAPTPPTADSYHHNPRRSSLPPIHQKRIEIKELAEGETSGYGSDNPHWGQQGGYESSSSARDDRAKWGDRGVGVGRFWEPQDVSDYSKIHDTPSWVRRGLEEGTELLVANSSPAESPEQDYGDDQRPLTSSTNSQTKTYIRGQNIPMDPMEVAERERRRRMALEHQEAIKRQLEEREKKKQQEREKLLQEERQEEMRIRREQEEERKRRDEEERKLQEKHEKELKRKEALKEALEMAEKKAKEQKMIKQRMSKKNTVSPINITENVEDKDKVQPSPILEEENESEQKPNNLTIATTSSNSTTKEKCHNNIHEIKETNINKGKTTPFFGENVAVMLQSYENLQNTPIAIIMPMQTTSETTPRPRTENRILTPTQYRNRNFCDCSTQTDLPPFKKHEKDEEKLREKMSNLDLRRPKWGANRPPTRYVKQSEKDPFYQRKKTRQKKPQYDDKNNNYSRDSSDDSQTASPRSYRRNGYVEKRRTRALWQKNVRELLPLQDEQIYYNYNKRSDCVKCCCGCRSDKHTNILKIESPISKTDDNSLHDSNNDVIDKKSLEKLNSLLVKQETWEGSSPRTTTS